MKRLYTRISISLIALHTESQLLEGSVASSSMKVQNVTVEPYVDGFPAEGFEEISFD